MPFWSGTRDSRRLDSAGDQARIQVQVLLGQSLSGKVTHLFADRPRELDREIDLPNIRDGSGLECMSPPTSRRHWPDVLTLPTSAVTTQDVTQGYQSFCFISRCQSDSNAFEANNDGQFVEYSSGGSQFGTEWINLGHGLFGEASEVPMGQEDELLGDAALEVFCIQKQSSSFHLVTYASHFINICASPPARMLF